MSRLRLPLAAASIFSICALVSCGFGLAQDELAPISANELFALIAGDALPENIVHAIEKDGLAFRPDDVYRAQLQAMGSDASILNAVEAAKIAPGAVPPEQADRDYLQRYVNAAQKMKAKDYEGVSAEMTALVKTSFDDSDAGCNAVAQAWQN